MHMQKQFPVILLLIVLGGCSKKTEFYSTGASYISESASEDYFTLSSPERSASILLSGEEDAGVLRALSDLQSDLIKVTGRESVTGSGIEVIIAGVAGKNPLIDQLIDKNLLDVTPIEGLWESSITTILKDPLPGVSKALVIAGSDKRGCIYGIYELSQQIGVSPWHFWSDVLPRPKNALYVIPGNYLLGEPAVKYRGIFINDEAPALSGWVHENYGGFNHQFYEHVFELILRMKGNYLWPAMWGRAFYDDDPENPRLAHEYGVVIGTTHHEPLMRAHVEWSRYGKGPWDYSKNKDTLQAFWKEGIERMGSNESIVSLGMRGDGDEPMTEGTAISLLENIVADQREIIEDVTGRSPDQTPQLWALYKEVQAYYDKGMRAPEDVTLLLCDDNWGNLRKLPQPGEEERAGGYGIYYHFDYVGGPRNYKWLNTTQIERVWEQMHLAYEHGVNQIWIVNVGDIKPMELPTQFFLDYAWDPSRWNAGNLNDYYEDWASQQFGSAFAGPVAEILAAYTKYNSRRKPELLSPETYSLSHYLEAERILGEYKQLEDLAKFIYEDIPAELKDAYYQLVLFPVLACANLNELYAATALNHLYASQRRSGTNRLGEMVRESFRKDSLLTRQYHHDLAGGKWNHMMSQTHIGYTYWQQPEQNKMPEVLEYSPPNRAIMAVALEYSNSIWPNSKEEARLPRFDSQNRQEYFIEVFNQGSREFNCSIASSEPWILASAPSMSIKLQERIYLGVDWGKVPEGLHSCLVEIKGPENASVIVSLEVDNRKLLSQIPKKELFVENNGLVSMEANHFQRAIDGEGIHWEEIPNLGRTLSSMITLPVIAARTAPGGNSPRLEYDFFVQDTGSYVLTSYLSPTLNYHNHEGLVYALSLDNDPPREINMHQSESLQKWEKWVANNINVQSTVHHITEPGLHTLKWWRVDAGVVLQKVVISKKDLTGLAYLGPPESLIINPKPPLPD